MAVIKDGVQMAVYLSNQVRTRERHGKAPGHHIAYSRGLPWPRFSMDDRTNSVIVGEELVKGRRAMICDAAVVTDTKGVLSGALKTQTDGVPLTPELLAAKRLIGVPGVPAVHAYATNDLDEVQAILFQKHSYSLADFVDAHREALAAAAPVAANMAMDVKPFLPQAFYVPVVAHVVDVLMRAHAAGVYHGNLTPSRVLFAEDGSVAVGDWSRAILVDGDPANAFVTGPHGQPAYMPWELRMRRRVPLNSSIDTTPLAYLAVLMAAGIDPAPVREMLTEGGIDAVLALLPACTRELVRRAFSRDVNDRPTLEEWHRVWPREVGAAADGAVEQDQLTELAREAAAARAARDGRAFKSSPGEAPGAAAHLREPEDTGPRRRGNSADGRSGSLTTFQAVDFKALAAVCRAEAAGAQQDDTESVRQVAQAPDTTGGMDVPKERAVHIAVDVPLGDMIPVGASGAMNEVDWVAVMGPGWSRPGEALLPAKSAVSFASMRSGRQSRVGDTDIYGTMSSEFETRLWTRRFVSSVGEAKSAAGSMPGKISDTGELKPPVSTRPGFKGTVKAIFMKMRPSVSCFRPADTLA